MPDLDDFGAAAQGGGGQGGEAVRLLVGGDYVEVGSQQPLLEGVSRSGAKAISLWWTPPSPAPLGGLGRPT